MSLLPLPNMLLFEQHGNDWDAYRIVIYKHFMDNVVQANLTFLGRRISYPRIPEYLGMHCSFWHLITEDRERTRRDEDRTVDFRRCERVSWLAHVLRCASDPDSGVLCWENKRGQNTHVALWVKEENFLVILAKRKDYYLLKTMYVHSDGKKKDLEKEQGASRDPRKD